MNFTRLQFWAKTGHDVLMLLNARHSRKYGTFNGNFPMVLCSSQVIDFDIRVWVVLLQSVGHLFCCHGAQISKSEDARKGWNLNS